MPPPYTVLLGSVSFFVLLLCYFSIGNIVENLSPQGCRMSWMSPSYVLQRDFDTSWSPLAKRYSLSLYREVGWDPSQIQGSPALFIPGNAGSSHQVRSIASSATRQFYSSPSIIASEFQSGRLKPLDFFTVEFNEDLSAFHGPTLESQIAYTSRAISYILSLYPANTSIIVMGHSMGGIVATSLLPSPNISAIITMSTPHVLPPARFDSRIEKLYHNNKRTLDSDPIPILSLCGGATDMMIPSESCILPMGKTGDVFRRTVFTSALEGAWTGVGHREMVWCHQVRWRIARAALEMGVATSSRDRGDILDAWLRDGHTLPPTLSDSETAALEFNLADRSKYKMLAEGVHMVLANPRGSHMYLLPVPPTIRSSSTLKAVVFVALGSIPPVSPLHSYPLHVSVFLCMPSPTLGAAEPVCGPLKPTLLKLIPNPAPGMLFPLPNEGTDESEGAIVFEADIPPADERMSQRWLGIRVADAEGRGWVVGGFSRSEEVVDGPSTFSLLFGRANVVFPDKHALRYHFLFPNILSSALIVYRYTPTRPVEKSWCSDPLLAPLIAHTSQPSETHYFSINAPDRHILLHSHLPAPYIPSAPTSPRRTLDLVIYSSGSITCNMLGFTISIDWSATLGRWASRYLTTLISWVIGVVAVILFTAWGVGDRGEAMPTISESLSVYSRYTLQKLLLATFLVAFIPIPVEYYLGTIGEIFFTPIAPILLLTASGLVCVSWWLLICLMWPIRKLSALASRRPRRRVEAGVHGSTIVSMGLIFLLIFFFVPWQVAYLGCWLIHLFNCGWSTRYISPIKPSATSGGASIPQIRITAADNGVEDKHVGVKNHQAQQNLLLSIKTDNYNHNIHMLLLMTWLLPLVAPVLAVWVRTLITAGLTTPFDGDHDFLNVAPFLILVDFASWNTGVLFEQRKFEQTLSARWGLAVLGGVAFFIGPRRAYAVFDTAKIVIGLIVAIRVGRRYWGGTSWAVKEHRTAR